ncbi:MAG: DUF6069 family protein [Oscillochloridaceae bacterium umkhey_bin13]
MTNTAQPSTITADGTDRSRILKAGLIAVGGSVAANLILRALLGLFFDLSADFPPYNFGSIAFFSVLPTTIAVGLFWLLARFTARPVRLFTIIAAVVFVVTLGPNLALAANPAAAPFPGQASDFLTLILFHLPPAVITVWALLTQTRASR